MTVATYAAAQLLRVLPRTRITRVVGRLVDLPLPPRISEVAVGVYARAYNVDLDEAAPRSGPFESFDAFFTRELREGARPACADPKAIVWEADGRVADAGPVHASSEITVKGKPYRVEDLVGDAADAERYQGGSFHVVYLSPRDYHRVHAPVAGKLTVVRSMAGDLYPVNSIGERHVPSLFARNRRVAIVIDTDEGHRVTVVMVSAMIVGRVTVSGVEGRDVPLGNHTLDTPLALDRGSEIGIFHLGSTTVTFFEKGVADAIAVPSHPVRVGEARGAP